MHKNINQLINCVKRVTDISFPKLECRKTNSKMQKVRKLLSTSYST